MWKYLKISISHTKGVDNRKKSDINTFWLYFKNRSHIDVNPENASRRHNFPH